MDNDIAVPDLSMYPEVAREAIVEAIAFQQNSYELSSDWNVYKETEHLYLKQNIRYSMGGYPDAGYKDDSVDEKMEADCNEEKNEKDEKNAIDEEKRKLELDRMVEIVYERIVEASRTKKCLYVGILFNVLCNIDKKDNPTTVPVFRVKRCMENEDEEARESRPEKNRSKSTEIGVTALYPWCTSYVDIEGRIYKNWTDYVTNNTLPKCLMVFPMGGFYQENPSALNTDEKTYVWIEIGPSPSAGNILLFMDVASSVLGVGALGIGIAAIAAPVAAPVLLASTICGAVSGAYATARSTQTLIDRKQHQQSISVKDRAARSAWLGVAGGVAGGLASGSTVLLSKAAKAGATLGLASRTTYNAIAIGNIVVNGMGIGNGIFSIYQNYRDTKKVSKLEVVQVVAHILFFGNAVINFKTARTIINDTQQKVLQDYENSLRSNRHRKAFKRIKRVTRASNGDTTVGDSEIIRAIRSIKNKDDFFAGIVRSRKILNACKAEVTFKDGYATINDNVRFDPVEFSQQPTDVRLNTVNAAEPFTPATSKSILLNSNEMPEAVYREQFVTITRGIGSALDFVRSTASTEGIEYVKRLVFELQNFTAENTLSLMAKLSKIALEVVQRTRRFVNNSIEELIYDLWLFVIPKVKCICDELGIDASNMVNSPVLAELVSSVTMNVVDKIFDGLENYLEEIIDSFSSRSTEVPAVSACSTIPPPEICSDCSGYILRDS